MAFEKRIPESFLYLSKQSLKYLIGAYTDTDSCVDKNRKSIQYKTTSCELKNTLIRAINKLGFIAKYYYDELTDSYAIYVLDSGLFMLNLYDYSFKIRSYFKKDELANSRSFGLKVHKDMVVRLLKENGVSLKKICTELGINLYKKDSYISTKSLYKINSKYDGIIPEYLVNPNIQYVEITCIDNCGKHNVYDITVDNRHNFVCNNIIYTRV